MPNLNLLELLTLFHELSMETSIPKPQGSKAFTVRGRGKRRGQNALIYNIPNNKRPCKPYQKGITKDEWEASCQQLLDTGEFSKVWFTENLHECANEGSCNYTTIGGLMEHFGVAVYSQHGLYCSV